jgi:hypothetical protein
MGKRRNKERILEIVVEHRNTGHIVVFDVIADYEIPRSTVAPGKTVTTYLKRPVISACSNKRTKWHVEVKLFYVVLSRRHKRRVTPKQAITKLPFISVRRHSASSGAKGSKYPAACRVAA